MSTPAGSDLAQDTQWDVAGSVSNMEDSSFSIQQKDNLARIRDNQRRSRARRREYLQELEQRLRLCELQGVEASAEVQMAARRVAEENGQLRELLNKHGFSDEHITHYLQTGSVALPELSPAQSYTVGDPGVAVQTLHQVIAPRRPVGLDPSAPFSLPSQSSRETSAASVSTSSSSVWESSQPTIPSYGHRQPTNVATHAYATPGQQPYSHAVYASHPAPDRTEAFQGQMPGPFFEDPRQHIGTPQSVSSDSRSTHENQFNMPMAPYKSFPNREYGHHEDYC